MSQFPAPRFATALAVEAYKLRRSLALLLAAVAPLLIAVVASYRKSGKVPRWEQEAVASGVAHVLSLLLDEAGWGVIWRTGSYTRSKAVAKMHGLGKNEELLGWLYVGGKPPRARSGRRKTVDARPLLGRLTDKKK